MIYRIWRSICAVYWKQLSKQLQRDRARTAGQMKAADCLAKPTGLLGKSSPLELLECVVDSIRSVLHEFVYQVETSSTNCLI